MNPSTSLEKNLERLPLVTIGLPVFNGEAYLAEAIESILAQSFTQFKLVISDNCSTDSTPHIIEKYKNLDSRITSFRQKSNNGALKNFIAVSEKLTTPYFMWFAHDDIMEKDFLNTCTNILNNQAINAAFTSIANIDKKGRVVREYPDFHKLPGGKNVWSLIRFIFSPEFDGKANLIYSLFRSQTITEALNKNGTLIGVPWGGDLCFIFSLLAGGSNFFISPKILFKKRIPESPNEIGREIYVPKSYFLRSAKPAEHSYLKKNYTLAIKENKRSSILKSAVFLRHALLNSAFVVTQQKHAVRHKINLTYHFFKHRANLIMRAIKKLIK